MAGFSDLSNELVLEILQHVAPKDLVSACTITKSISLLAASILEEHRRLERQFSTIDDKGSSGQVKPSSELLSEVLVKPRLGQYVQSLGVHSWGFLPWCACEDLASSQSWNPQCDFLPLVKTAIESAEILEASEIDNAIQHGVEYQTILALLLLHLPNLEVLEFITAGNMQHLSRTTQRIKNAPESTYLSHLKSVSIYAHHEKMPDATSFIACLISLPSLTSCYMNGLVLGGEERDLERHLRPHESNVSDLTFVACDVGEKVFLRILESIKCLRSFTCLNMNLYNRPAQPANPRYGLYLSLLGSSISSLEKLTFMNLDDEYLNIKNCNLHEFEELRDIEINLDQILNVFKPSGAEISKMLPPSLRIMRLRPIGLSSRSKVAAYEWYERIQEAILSVLETKDVLLPQLTEIHLILRYDEDPESGFEDVSRACRAQGVLFTVDEPFHYIRNLPHGLPVRRSIS